MAFFQDMPPINYPENFTLNLSLLFTNGEYDEDHFGLQQIQLLLRQNCFPTP